MSKKNYDDNAYEDEEEEEESDDNKTNISKKEDHKDIPKKVTKDTGTGTPPKEINKTIPKIKPEPKEKKELFRTINNKEIVKNKTFKNYLRCIRCGQLKLKNPIEFTCNHITCFNCLIKDLTLSQFKNCENKDSIIFRCSCNVGTASFSYDKFQKILIKINTPIPPRKCKEHSNEGTKYCRDCELWLCDKCLEIHKVFNQIHSLEEKELPLREICDTHSEYTLYYCMQCRKEICSYCVANGGKHKDHKYIKFSEFNKYIKEIKDKLKFKTLDECEKNLEEIRNKKIKEKKEKIDKFNNQTEELIKMINSAKDFYLKDIEEKMEYLNKVIDLMKESYKYFYNLLENEKQDYYTLDYLKQIVEITDMKTAYSNYDELIDAMNLITKFKLKTPFLYEINTTEMPSPYTVDSFSFNRLKRSANSKYSYLNIKQFKYEKKINIILNSITCMVNLDNNGIAIAAGNDIIIIEDLNNYDPDNPDTMSDHTKTITSLVLLSDNKLASGSEDKTIKLWDVKKRQCISTITGNYECIYSLLKINDNTLAAGSFNTIRVFNTDNKKELYSLIGHEKSVCTMIKLGEDKIISGGYDNLIKIWDLNNKICDASLFGHDTTVFVVLLLQDGRLASGSGSRDKALKIWDLDNKKCECTLLGHRREIKCMAQMKNGWLLTGSVDKTIKVWNIKRKCCIQTLVSHFDAVNSLCILDKDKFISGSKDKDIIIWKY